MKTILSACAIIWSFYGVSAAPLFESELIFDPDAGTHGHTHASCIVECPNGDMLAVWYENGSLLPPPHFSEQKDKSDDVRLGGSRLPKGSRTWEKSFVMKDTFGASDNNPCMIIDREKRLWLVYPTLVGVPEWTWSSALLRYAISTDYEKPGPPVWSKENVLLPRPDGFKEVVEAAIQKHVDADKWPAEQVDRARERAKRAFERPAAERLGWMPRAHPIVRNDGAVMLPLANGNFNIACMPFTLDGGETWTLSKPVPDIGLEQPTIAQFADGAMIAFFRNGAREHRIKRSDSSDGGVTWGEVTFTDRLHPGSGIEAIALADGNLLLIYNDTEDDPRDKLAVSMSSDRGKTWQWTRHLENEKGRRFDYPSIVQSMDGTIHATYTVDTKTIKHAHFDEEWIKADSSPK
jgi:predicted neuraminidase